MAKTESKSRQRSVVRQRALWVPDDLRDAGLTGLFGERVAVSDRKDGAVRYAPNVMKTWRRYPFARLQPATCRNGILIDVDDRDPWTAVEESRRLGLPEPAWVTRHNGGGQVMYCLASPVMLGDNASRAAQGYYDAVRNAMVALLGGDPHGTGFARQRNPVCLLNQATFLRTDRTGVTLSDLAAGCGLKRRSDRELVDAQRGRVLREAILEDLRPNGRVRWGTVSQRIEKACVQAAYIWPGGRHKFLALDVMRGHLGIAKDQGFDPHTWTATLDLVNSHMPVPFKPGESGGVEGIVKGLIKSWRTDKMFAKYNSEGNKLTQSIQVLKAMGRASSKKRREAVRPRNILIGDLHQQGFTPPQIVEEVVRRGFPRISRPTVSNVISKMKPFGESDAIKRQRAVELWLAGHSHSENARRVGIHRITVIKAILRHIERENDDLGGVRITKNAHRTPLIEKALEGKQVAYK